MGRSVRGRFTRARRRRTIPWTRRREEGRRATDGRLDATYQRCDQENVIEQLGSGIAAWRMPVAELAGNHAWLEIARLAWNLGKWVAQLALPAEVVRWEWKRFRHAFVIVPAQVIRRAAQIWIRVSASHRFVEEYLAAHVRLQR